MLFKVLIVIIFILGDNAHSSIKKEAFCEELTAKNKNRAVSFRIGSLLTSIFTPSKLVRYETIQHVDNAIAKSVSSRNPQLEKYVLVLLESASLTEKEKERYKRQRKNLKREIKILKKLDLTKRLRKIDNYQKCLLDIEAFPDEFTLIKKHLEKAKKWNKLKKKIINNKLYESAKKKIKFLKKKGWKVLFDLSLREAYNLLSISDEAVILAHSTESGILVDNKKNQIPRSFFKRLGNKIKRLSIFTCNGRAVIDHYELANVRSQLEIKVSLIKEQHKKMFNKSVPVMALKSLKRALFQPYTVLPQKSMISTCLVQVTHEQISADTILPIRLNSEFIGFIQNEQRKTKVRVPCHELFRPDMRLEIVNITNDKISDFKVSDVQIDDKRVILDKLYNFYSKLNNRFILSRVNFLQQKENL